MKIEILTRKYVKEIIDVDFPYYYEHDLMLDNSETIIYGKIFPDHEITITESESYDGVMSYEIKKTSRSNCYFTKEHKSTAKEFEGVLSRMLGFVNENCCYNIKTI